MTRKETKMTTTTLTQLIADCLALQAAADQKIQALKIKRAI